ncbi:MAG TPA: 16S rRNA (cytosine(1402)-N(4))-methyltransferase RsmH [Pusillimonas sp.]|uniref:16S rRNA (cytosine(1402)-N(4))-methyltransferase RsmH n=1 Tax=Pusillimonas sp. TaxID=3040095 RepID=UPI002BD93A0D|nr:16S rRNA (cytosine(1402)-N(4))-methyltransferase RsmH [Pusillimonas sp.]HUH86501.1 16S rRNA (cytosine(1402)-N(4))-methyltransferase RsmH [Pusillimonas sp.]
MEFTHRPVLLEPTVNALVDPGFDAKARVFPVGGDVLRPSGVYVDGTFGRGGHSRLLLSRLGPDARLVVFDKDPVAIKAATELQAADPRVMVVHGGFASMQEELEARGVMQVDGIMLDLGISSPQIDDAERGFSFMREGPLDMRMDTSRGLTAAQWLAQAGVEEIKEVIAKYGEERFAFQIAKAIAARRESRPLRTTLDLAELVASVVRTREKGQHPATRTFQALRIHINQELEELARALAAALRLLAPGGRLAVISFHSLEDRMVKQCIAAARRRSEAQARLPIFERDMPQPILTSLGKVLPSEQETKENARARSAVLRVAQRTDAPLPPDAGASFINEIRLVPQHDSRLARRKR